MAGVRASKTLEEAVSFDIGGLHLVVSIETRLNEDARGSLARMLYRQWKIRDRLLGSRVGAEPAWNLLLYLYIAEEEGRLVSVTSASFAAAVPPSTGLRWISKLAAAGFVLRTRSVGRRAVWLSLTKAGREAIAKTLARILLDSKLEPFRHVP